MAHIPPKSKLKRQAKNQKELLDINDTVVFKLLNSKYNLLIFAFKLFLTLVGLVISKILHQTYLHIEAVYGRVFHQVEPEVRDRWNPVVFLKDLTINSSHLYLALIIPHKKI